MSSVTLIPEDETGGFRDLSAAVGGNGETVQSTPWKNGGAVCRTLREPSRGSTLSGETDTTTTGPLPEPHVRSPLIRLPAGTLPHERVEVLQQWEGVVDEVTADSFFAQLHDLGREPSDIEIVEIPLDEVPPDDRPLVAEGALFYLSVGYETSTGGQLRRVSEIRFQRTPRWTKRALEQAKLRAEKLFELHGQREQASSGE